LVELTGSFRSLQVIMKILVLSAMCIKLLIDLRVGDGAEKPEPAGELFYLHLRLSAVLDAPRHSVGRLGMALSAGRYL
jgi:hypothetical protein